MQTDVFAFGMCVLEMIFQSTESSSLCSALSAQDLGAMIARVQSHEARAFVVQALRFDYRVRATPGELLAHEFLMNFDEDDAIVNTASAASSASSSSIASASSAVTSILVLPETQNAEIVTSMLLQSAPRHHDAQPSSEREPLLSAEVTSASSASASSTLCSNFSLAATARGDKLTICHTTSKPFAVSNARYEVTHGPLPITLSNRTYCLLGEASQTPLRVSDVSGLSLFGVVEAQSVVASIFCEMFSILV